MIAGEGEALGSPGTFPELWPFTPYRHIRQASRLRGKRLGKGADMARKRNGSDTWHFCSNCSQWPTSNYVTGTGSSGEKCNECLAKQRSGNCN